MIMTYFTKRTFWFFNAIKIFKWYYMICKSIQFKYHNLDMNIIISLKEIKINSRRVRIKKSARTCANESISGKSHLTCALVSANRIRALSIQIIAVIREHRIAFININTAVVCRGGVFNEAILTGTRVTSGQVGACAVGGVAVVRCGWALVDVWKMWRNFKLKI